MFWVERWIHLNREENWEICVNCVGLCRIRALTKVAWRSGRKTRENQLQYALFCYKKRHDSVSLLSNFLLWATKYPIWIFIIYQGVFLIGLHLTYASRRYLVFSLSCCSLSSKFPLLMISWDWNALRRHEKSRPLFLKLSKSYAWVSLIL